MTEVAKYSPDTAITRKILRALGLSASGLVLGASSGALYFDHSDIKTEIAATSVEISPTYVDTFVTLQNGLLPDVRMPSDTPFGLTIDVGNSTIPSGGMASDNGKRLEAAYAALAAQPDGEVAKVTQHLKHKALESLAVGLLVGMLPIGFYTALGAERRKELADNGRIIPALAAAALVTSAAGTVIDHAAPAESTNAWIPLTKLSGGIAPPELQGVEVKDNAVTGIGTNLLKGIVERYEQSKEFYDTLEQAMALSGDTFHQATDTQTVALLVSDRHDNIGMDPVLRATGDVAGASILIDAGDDTSSGQQWETFSLRSLLNNFKDYRIVAVGGNHDNDGFVIDYLGRGGAVTPDDAIQTVEGITMALASDPRRSDYTPERAEGPISFDEAETSLTELACQSEERVALAVVHDANMASEALDEGCVDLVLGGHTHVYSGPRLVKGDNEQQGYSVTNGTSGGATFSFALGRKLQKEASATVITFEAGKPVGVQPVIFHTDGTYTVGAYQRLSFTEDTSITASHQSSETTNRKKSTASSTTPAKK